MAMMLPGWLETALNYLGYNWPSTNEDVLRSWGSTWSALQGTLSTHAAGVEGAVAHVCAANTGAGVEAFRDQMTDGNSNLVAIKDLGTASSVIGVCCQVGAGIVVAMKLVVIGQLVLLALAIAEAAATLGIGAGIALAAREIAKRLVDAAINLAVGKILGA